MKEAVGGAREQVTNLIGAKPGEIVFTSGGSESDNYAIIGASLANRKKGRHIITSRIEHPAVLEACRYLEETFGFKVTYLPVDKYCLVSPEDVENTITDETILITIMHSNNEVGADRADRGDSPEEGCAFPHRCCSIMWEDQG